MKKLTVLTLTLLFVVSCGNNSRKKDKLKINNTTNAVSTKSKSKGKCLIKYREKLDEIITDSQVFEATGKSNTDLDKEYNKVLKNPDYHSLTYSWKTETGRKQKVGGMEFAAYDHLTIAPPEKMELGAFKRGFYPKSEEALKRMEESINKEYEKALEGKSKSNEANKQGKKLSEMGVDKNTAKSTGNAFVKMAIEIAKNTTIVEGLGDAATWNTKNKKLNVNVGGVSFAVIVDFGSNDKSLKIAKTLAQNIIDNCD